MKVIIEIDLDTTDKDMHSQYGWYVGSVLESMARVMKENYALQDMRDDLEHGALFTQSVDENGEVLVRMFVDKADFDKVNRMTVEPAFICDSNGHHLPEEEKDEAHN